MKGYFTSSVIWVIKIKNCLRCPYLTSRMTKMEEIDEQSLPGMGNRSTACDGKLVQTLRNSTNLLQS